MTKGSTPFSPLRFTLPLYWTYARRRPSVVVGIPTSLLVCLVHHCRLGFSVPMTRDPGIPSVSTRTSVVTVVVSFPYLRECRREKDGRSETVAENNRLGLLFGPSDPLHYRHHVSSRPFPVSTWTLVYSLSGRVLE